MNDWPKDEKDAADRARRYLNLDPFPDIPRALLSKHHIEEYAREIALIWPAEGIAKGGGDPPAGALKSASYETRPGVVFMHYDEGGDLIQRKLDEEGTIRLPANSITFVSTRDRFFLPNYIAMRFNLRIKHVHRGLLLGTGPLVDPGYHERILIPLHNLTDREYHISTGEGLIWVEFTKTSAPTTRDRIGTEAAELVNPPSLPRNTQKSMIEHLFKASGGLPIRSSLPTTVREVKETAETADRRSKLLQGIGIFALVSFVIGLVSVFLSILSLLSTVNGSLSDLKQRVAVIEKAKP